MKVKITKTSKQTYWYHDMIGETFEVEDFDSTDYKVIRHKKFTMHFIKKVDCQPLKKK